MRNIGINKGNISMIYVNLEKALKESEMTQAEIAYRSGINEGRISQLIRNPHMDTKASTLVRLCQVVGISINEAVAVIRETELTRKIGIHENKNNSRD